jgi:hypothetical protein
MSEQFLKMANGAMQDYTRFLTDKSEKSDKSEKPTGKDKQRQDSGVKFDNNAAGTSKAAGKDPRNGKKHDPNIVCLRCNEPGHIARLCTNQGKPALTYTRPVSQHGDRGGDKGSESGKGKGEKKGSVAAAVAAETPEDEYRDLQRFQEWKEANSSKSTRRK